MTMVTASTPPEPLLDLQRLVAGIRWRRRIWVAAAVFGMLAGALLALLSPPQPAAVAQLLIVRANDQPSAGASLMQTDVALLKSTRIAAAALQRIGVNESAEQFLGDYEAEGLTGNVVEVTVRGTSERDALARAGALVDAFIADHVQRTRDIADARAAVLIERGAEIESDLAAVDSEIDKTAAAGGSAAALDTLYARRAELTAQSSDIARRAEEAGIGAPDVAAGTQMVDTPRVLPQSLAVTGAVTSLIGLVLGLFTGLGVAAVASVVGDRPVLRREVAEALGASVIAQLPQPRRGPLAQRRGAGKRSRVAATLVRLIRDDPGAVSVLELGCPDTAAALALNMAEQLSVDHPVVVIDDLPDRQASAPQDEGGPIRVLDGAEYAAGLRLLPPRWGHRIGVGSVSPGTAWTDLGQLGSEAILVVRAGYADTLWLHIVGRQLADSGIPVLGIVLVRPDPRDRTDGTLWDGVHTALRGRAARHVGSNTSAGTAEISADRLLPVGTSASGNGEIT